MRKILSCLLLVQALLPSPCHADDAEARARAAEHFRAGERAFAKRAYVVAAEEFEKADALSPHEATKMNAADAWERGGELDRAAELADVVLSAKTESAARESAAALLARVGPSLATLEIVGDPTKSVRIGDRLFNPPKRIRQKPGTYELVVQGLPSRRIELIAGGFLTVDTGRGSAGGAPPPSKPKVLVSAPDPVANGSRGTGAWVSIGTGIGLTVASAGAFSVFGAMTIDAKKSYEADPTVSRRDTFYRNRILTNVALGATAVFAASTLVVVFTTSPQSRPPTAGSVGLGLGLSNISLSGIF